MRKETEVFNLFLLLCCLNNILAYDLFSSVYHPGIRNTFIDDERYIEVPKVRRSYSVREKRTKFTGYYGGTFYTSREYNKNNYDVSSHLSYETTSAKTGRRVATFVRVDQKQIGRKFYRSKQRRDVHHNVTARHRSKRTRRNVYGRDDRSYIPIRQGLGLAEPYSYTVKISTGCTGIVITPRHVLTAAHCIHDQKDYVKGSKGLKVGFFLANTSMEWVSVKTMKVSKGWVDGGATQGPFYDYALLKLSKKHNKPYIPISISDHEQHGIGERISFTSFEDDKPKNTMWYRSCSVIEDDSSFLYHYCDAKPGSSGSGVYTWVYDNQLNKWQRELVGVFSGNRWKIYDDFYIIMRNFNVAVRLTAARFAQICEWLGSYKKIACSKRNKSNFQIVTKR